MSIPTFGKLLPREALNLNFGLVVCSLARGRSRLTTIEAIAVGSLTMTSCCALGEIVQSP